ncbi:MAG: LamG-like jellyroll fold domain-containing protein [Chitinophagaceae bacterium]
MTQTFFQLKFIKTSLIWIFFLGVVFASCGKKDSTPPPPPADKVALNASIAIAQGLNDNTVEGTKPNQYEVGSKAALKTALDASKLVAADVSATQAAVNNTTAQLDAAIAAYQGHLIKEIAAANLIGFWKMNGNANDSSGNSNNGVVTAGHAFYGAGTPTLTADRFARAGMAYHFDKGGNINVPYKASLNPAQMSISLWAQWSSTGRTVNTDTYTMVAMNRWNGYKFQLQSGHLPFYTVKVVKAAGDTTIYDRDDAGVAIAENTWRHIVVTFKSGEMKFYIDGDLVKTWDAASSGPVPGNALTLLNPIDFVIGQDLPTSKYLTVDGDFQVAWGGFWTGDMDDVMFYNIALDDPQVKSVFTNQKTL